MLWIAPENYKLHWKISQVPVHGKLRDFFLNNFLFFSLKTRILKDSEAL